MSLPQTVSRRELVRWLSKIDTRGWVANHDGNVTLLLDDNRLLATPTAFSKAEIRDEDLLVIDKTGKVLAGRHRIFSEINLHLRAFELRPDIRCVLHAHPPTATGFAVAGLEPDPCIIAEAVISLGNRIPLVPYALPGTLASSDVLNDFLVLFDAVILQNHGVLTVGDSIEQAFLRMELVEHIANIHLHATQLGQMRRVPEHDIERLLEKRTKAGLGPLARGQLTAATPQNKRMPHSAASAVPHTPHPTTRTVVGPCGGPRTFPTS